jgi:GNAT superfamily N-acetyltransferase
MDLTSSRIAALARYWEAKRGSRAMPLWSDIDPAEIKPLLPRLMVVRYERNPFRVRYALVGTWLVQYSGSDFTNRYLDELDFSSEPETDWPAIHAQFVRDARPLFGYCRFIASTGLEWEYEAALFPIAAADGVTVERALCIEDFPEGTEIVPDARTVPPAPRLIAPAETAAGLAPVGAGDPLFRAWLEEARLPTADLVGAGKHYYRLNAGADCVGFGGIEVQGAHALLRSIVIEGRQRGHGYGRTLVQGLLAAARGLGLKDAYILTETAAPFFAALGFLPCDRASAPPEIVLTEQFSTLCPQSAKLMRLEL